MEKTIIVKEILPSKTGTGKRGSWERFSFKADDGLAYGTFDTKVANFFKVGATLKVTVKDDEYKTDITQVAVITPPIVPTAGAPLIAEAQKLGAITRETPVERPNFIEKQVAIKEIGEALRANIEVSPQLEYIYWSWIADQFGVKLLKENQDIK